MRAGNVERSDGFLEFLAARKASPESGVLFRRSDPVSFKSFEAPGYNGLPSIQVRASQRDFDAADDRNGSLN
jgi:hypothetical protein